MGSTGEERRVKMEGKIEKHTLSSGQDIKREKHKHTSTRSLRECRQSGIHTENTATMLCALRFQGASVYCQVLPYIIYQYSRTYFMTMQRLNNTLLIICIFWPPCQKIHVEINISFSSEFFKATVYCCSFSGLRINCIIP